jgi:cyclic pyranopterin phosphate synthase
VCPLQPESNLLQRNEIFQLASIFAQNGVDKIRLTGGEPLLRKDLIDIVSDLRSIDGIDQIGMTTNGVTLTRHLTDLLHAGLSACEHIARYTAGGQVFELDPTTWIYQGDAID